MPDMNDDRVTVVEFTRWNAPFRTGERAAFANDVAQALASQGSAKIVAANVPRVNPETLAHDAREKLEQVRLMMEVAGRDARASRDTPDAAAMAARAMETLAESNRLLKQLKDQLDAGLAPPAPDAGTRRPGAGQRAA